MDALVLSLVKFKSREDYLVRAYRSLNILIKREIFRSLRQTVVAFYRIKWKCSKKQ